MLQRNTLPHKRLRNTNPVGRFERSEPHYFHPSPLIPHPCSYVPSGGARCARPTLPFRKGTLALDPYLSVTILSRNRIGRDGTRFSAGTNDLRSLNWNWRNFDESSAFAIECRAGFSPPSRRGAEQCEEAGRSRRRARAHPTSTSGLMPTLRPPYA